MRGRISLNTLVTRFLAAAALLMAVLTETVIIILFVRVPRPHPRGLDPGLTTIAICVLCLGLGGIHGHRVIGRLKSNLNIPAEEPSLSRASHLFFGMALVGYLAVIEGLMLVTGLLSSSKIAK